MGCSIRTMAVLACVALLAGCGKGLDRSPDFASLEKYKEKIKEAAAEATQEELAAYDWAVSDQTFDSLKAKYSGKSYRAIAVAEAEKVITDGKTELPQLEKLKAQFDPIVAELMKIEAVTSDARPTPESFMPSDKFAFKASITNKSKYDYSSLRWQAKLRLDGGKDVVATAAMYDGYESVGGLKAGRAVSSVMKPNTFLGDGRNWTSLAVMNAKERNVELVLTDAFDFKNKSYLEGAPYARINKLTELMAAADHHLKALRK